MGNNIDLVRAFLAALEGGDSAPIAELVTTDVVEVLPLSAEGGLAPAAVFEGKAAVLEVQATIVSAFATVEFVDPQITESADGQMVYVEAVGRRVQRGTGRTYENVYLLKFELRDGLICRITEYSNPVAFATFFDLPLGGTGEGGPKRT